MNPIIQHLNDHLITIITVPGCGDCKKMKLFLSSIGVESSYISIFDLNKIDEENYESYVLDIVDITNTRACPMLFFKNIYIGDLQTIIHKHACCELQKVLKKDLEIYIDEISF
jgi:glutaredoxin